MDVHIDNACLTREYRIKTIHMSPYIGVIDKNTLSIHDTTMKLWYVPQSFF